jgi:hypothetical protein
MSSKTYYDGKDMESNVTLHTRLIETMNFDTIEIRGEVTTKGDVVGISGNIEVPVSIKHGSQKNTQVHLPTLRSFSKALNVPSEVTMMLEQWLGVHSYSQFESWLKGKTPTAPQKKYKRLFATDIAHWDNVVRWFNDNNKKIAELLIQAMNGENPAKYLVWVNKDKNTFQVIDIPKLIEWISTECKWVTGPRNNGSTLRCENSDGKPIFHLQMKGNKIKENGVFEGEYNHNPQFHIHTHWPESVIFYQGTLVV